MDIMEKEPIKLIPRYCKPEDILKGWVVIHSGKNPLEHLDNTKIKCLNTGKTIYCRIRGPGTKNGGGIYYQNGLTEEEVKNSMFLDASYVQKLGLGEHMEKEIQFLISKGFCLWSCLGHPEDSIRVGLILGIIGLTLGIFSLLPHVYEIFVGLITIVSKFLTIMVVVIA